MGLVASISASTAVAQTPSQPSLAAGNTHTCLAFYPDIARRKNESGNVLVGYDVSADGTITHVAVLKSSGYPELDLAALQCVSTQWRNLPATKNGAPVASPGHRALIRFTLSGPGAPPVAARPRVAAAPDASLPIVLILSGVAIMGLAAVLARYVTRPRISG